MSEITGVYKITSPSGKVYIGSSVNMQKRWANYNAPSQARNQPKLFNSFSKYGIKEHTFEIIEECDKDVLTIRERFWQEYYDVLNLGLNCRYVETNEKVGKDSEETRKKKSLSKIGSKHYKSEKVVCADTKRVWDCVRDCAEEIGMNKHTLWCKLSNRVANTTPYYFLRDSHRIEEVCKQEKGERFGGRSKYIREGKDHPNSKPVICTLTGKIWDSVTHCAKENDLNHYTLRDWLNGTYKNKTTFQYLINE